MLLAEFSIWPMDKGESVGIYVARCLDIVDRSGLPYKLGPLGTCIEGEWPEVMSVVQKCYEELAKDCTRISCTLQNGLAQRPHGPAEKQDGIRRAKARPQIAEMTSAIPIIPAVSNQ